MITSLPSPPSNGFQLGPLFVHAYGLAYVLAVIAAVAITVRRWQARGGRRELVYEVALWGFPAGLIGGRISLPPPRWHEVPPPRRRAVSGLDRPPGLFAVCHPC